MALLTLNAPPATTIPPEILAVIFAAATPPTRSRYVIPWEVTVSHVCARWRVAAFDTALMWTNIEIYSGRCLDRVSSYLTRSGSCLIEIWLDLWQTDKDGARGRPGWVDPIVDLIIQHVGRWRCLLVFTYYKSTTNAILSKIADLGAPMLQRIRVVDEGEGSREEVAPWDSRILAGGVPSLVSVQMDRVYYLPLLANVTTLHLHTPLFKVNTTVVSALASACPLLTTLSIHGSFNAIEEDWAIGRHSPIAMHSLRHFWFCNDAEDMSVASFLISVALPQLTSLWLDLPRYYLRVLHLLSTHPSRPMFPSLKHLTLQSFDFYPTLQAAKVFPNVTTIHFAYCPSFHVSFLKNILCADVPYWRHLDTLVFRTSKDSHAQKFSSILLDIFTQRAASGLPIKRLLLDKDALQSLVNHVDSMRDIAVVEKLTPFNYEDPWWLMAQSTYEDRF